jgi:hypothetical protein
MRDLNGINKMYSSIILIGSYQKENCFFGLGFQQM